MNNVLLCCRERGVTVAPLLDDLFITAGPTARSRIHLKTRPPPAFGRGGWHYLVSPGFFYVILHRFRVAYNNRRWLVQCSRMAMDYSGNPMAHRVHFCLI